MKMLKKLIKKLIIKMINNNYYEKNKQKYNKASLLTKLLSKKWCLKFIYIYQLNYLYIIFLKLLLLNSKINLIFIKIKY